MTEARRIFFLGGADLEMVEIGQILSENGQLVIDKNLGWGAKASDYAEEIEAAGYDGLTSVLIELEVDVDLPYLAVVVDHHGERAREAASILQVLDLLEIEPTQRHQLIGANDSGYIPGMVAMGATLEEIAEIRMADRFAQGITSEQETEAEQAITEAGAYAQAETGELVVIRLAHSKCATVTDRLFSHWKDGKENLLILSGDGEANFYGNGALCSELKEKFEGWNGGAGLGDPKGQGFWGGYPNHAEVEAVVRQYLA